MLRVSQDAYRGDARYTVSIDGVQQGGQIAASAVHGTGRSDRVVLRGNWTGTHQVVVRFVNDLYDGDTARDRNLYVDSARYDGKSIEGAARSLYSQDEQDAFTFGQRVSSGPTPAPTPTSSAPGPAPTPTSPSSNPTPPSPSPSSVGPTGAERTRLKLSVHGFTTSDGRTWSMRGLNMTPRDAAAAIQGALLQQYPGITAIRLVCDATTDTPESISPVVQAYTSRAIVVEVEDHTDSNGGANTSWYTHMAQAYKTNPLVFLETPNEPPPDNLAEHQISIVHAVRAAGFHNPIGVQPAGGYDQGNIAAVTAAVGTTNLYVTPHIYYGGTDPNEAARYVANEIQGAASKGLYAVIDEFGNALDGWHLDPQGNTTIQAVIDANTAGTAGAIFWAADNNNHPDGADSAFLTPDATHLTPTGQILQPWLSQP